MKALFDEKWLAQAVELEEAADLDISAGPDFGTDLLDYLVSTEGTINEQNLKPALTSVLEDSLGTKKEAHFSSRF